MVERAFHDGDSDYFSMYVEQYNISLWNNRFVFDTIARDDVHQTKDRPEAHYDLVRDLLQFSIEHRTVDWDDDDVLYEWIHLLVEQKYPWHVCSVWNHLRPTAISFLHQCSMSCFHTGNLHMLLRQNMIAHLWDDCDFLSSMVDQASFFHKVESSRKFRKTVRKQLDFFPFHETSVLQTLVEALLLWKSHRVLNMFLTHSQHEQLLLAVPDLTQKVCYNHDVALYNNVRELFNQQGTIFTIRCWYEMFANVHRKHISYKTSTTNEALAGFKMFHHLLQTFDDCHEPEQWLELITFMPETTPFLTLFVHSPHAHELLDIVLQKTNTALDALPEDHTTYILSSNITLKWSLYSRDGLFHTIDSFCENQNGWTTFANALRWGNWQTVEWMLNHFGDKELLENMVHHLNVRTSSKPHRNDNALTLALYNPDNFIYEQIIRYADEFYCSDDWTLQDDGVSVITALSRLFFFHPQQSLERFEHLLSTYAALATKKNEMMVAFTNEWHDHHMLHRKTERTSTGVVPIVDNPLMQQLIQLPCAYTKESIVTMLTNCENEEQFDAFLRNITTTSTALIKEVYLCMGMNHDTSAKQLLKIEKLDVFQKLMANTQTDAHRFYLLWSSFADEVFHNFVLRMKHEWHQPFRHVMPADYTFYTDTHMNTYSSQQSDSIPSMWRTWLVAGMLPHYMYSGNHWTTVPVTLQKMLKAVRLLRRYLRRQYRTRYANKPLHHQRKKIRFMVKCRAMATMGASAGSSMGGVLA